MRPKLTLLFLKTTAIAIWLSPILCIVAFSLGGVLYGINTHSLNEKLAYLFFGLAFLPTIFTIGFFITFPNWFSLMMLFGLKKKIENTYWYILASNLLIMLTTLVLGTLCISNDTCSSSDAPLGSTFAWIILFLLSNLFGTLPFALLLNKSRNSLIKKKKK